MSDHFWLSEEQLAWIKPYFPLSHGVPRVDDRKVTGGIIHVIRSGLRRRDAPEVHGPHKTFYYRFIRSSRACRHALPGSGSRIAQKPPQA